MTYVEGFVVAVPTANKDAYLAHARKALPLFKEFGITRVVECWGDDVPAGKVTDFRRAVQAKDDETVLFSWFEYPSKAVRDAATQKMIADPRMEGMGADTPFDGMRMIFGGFAPLREDRAGGRMGYVDGAVIPVPDDRKADYETSSAAVSEVMKACGATRVIDAWGDDVPDGKITDYRRAVQLKQGETAVFAWIEWPSKEAREAGWAKAMTDPRMPKPGNGGGDMQRAIFGAFAPILDA